MVWGIGFMVLGEGVRVQGLVTPKDGRAASGGLHTYIHVYTHVYTAMVGCRVKGVGFRHPEERPWRVGRLAHRRVCHLLQRSGLRVHG